MVIPVGVNYEMNDPNFIGACTISYASKKMGVIYGAGSTLNG
jgi:hypothetical protein